jgi:hypothetical protein
MSFTVLSGARKERIIAVSFFFLYEEAGIFASYVLSVASRARTQVPCSTDYCPLRQILPIIDFLSRVEREEQ